MNRRFDTLGYAIGVFATALVLIWIGIFKFTPTEANAIKPLVENHFLMRWMYSVWSVQGVSNLIGAVEIMVGFGLLAALAKPKIGLYAGPASAAIFFTTLSFLFTTPDTWKSLDGVLITDFFIIKDLAYLGISVLVWAKGRE